MARIARNQSVFKVVTRPHDARQLVVTSDPPPDCLEFSKPPIVRVQPQPEHDELHVANVRETWEARGAHVRVMPRERAMVEATPATPVDNVSPRELVMLIATEVRSSAPEALSAMLEATMAKVGL